MRWFTQIAFQLKALLFKSKLETQLSEEIRAHVEMATEANVAKGISPKNARYAALKEFGGIEQVKERTRDERGILWLEQFWQDVSYAIRVLRKSPAFTITAVLTLALGIGVNSALFGLYNMVALQPLPVKNPDSLVHIEGKNNERTARSNFSYIEYVAYRESSRTLEELLASSHANVPLLSLAGVKRESGIEGPQPDAVHVELVSDNFFSMLGGSMQLGRGFLPEDFIADAAPVIVLSNRFWQDHFQGDLSALGATLTFKRRLVTVIGIAASEFLGQSSESPAGWLPLTLWSSDPTDYGPGGPQAFRLIGRIKAGTTEEQVKAELDVIASSRAIEFPSKTAKTFVRLKRVLKFLNIPPTPKNLARLSPLILGFGMVLLIACTNVANLLLARSASRQAEIGVRLTLGASRGRIVRQLLTENALLCVLGSVVGLGLGIWTLEYIITILLSPNLPPALVRSLDPTPDLRVLGYTALLTVGTLFVVGLLPALHTARANLIATVRNESTEFGVQLTPSRLRRLLVIMQVAACLTLLSSAGVFVQNLIAPEILSNEYDADAVFGVAVSPNTVVTDKYAAFHQALKTIEGLPGVAGSGGMSPGPFEQFNGGDTRIRMVATSGAEVEEEVSGTTFITAGFFEALGVPLFRGRTFNEREQHSASHAIIISKSLANRLWPDQEAVGKKLKVSEVPWRMGSREGPSLEGLHRECEVIGVAKKVGLHQDDDLLYLPFPLDLPKRPIMYILRPEGDSYAARAEIVRLAKAEGIDLQFLASLSAKFEPFEKAFHSLAILSSSLGALALAIASVGLYGLLAFVVGQRVQEIGIRMAIGGTAERVAGHFVRQVMRLVAIGLVFGLVGGWLFGLLVEKLYFGLFGAFDLLTFCAVTLLLTLIALFACWLPARRATKINPMVALKRE